MYLSQCKQHVFHKLISVDPFSWLMLAWLVTLDLSLRSIWPWYRSAFTGVPAIVALCIASFLLAFAVHVKIRAVLWALLHSEYASTISVLAPLAGDAAPLAYEASVAPSPASSRRLLVPVVPSSGSTVLQLVPPAEAAARHVRVASLLGATVRVEQLTDEAYAALHERHVREQRALFWCSRPTALLTLLQASIFLLAVAAGVAVLTWHEVSSSLGSILWTFLPIAATAVAVSALLQGVVPQYVLSIHTSDLVDVRLLVDAVVEHERHKRRLLRLERETASAAGDAASAARARLRCRLLNCGCVAASRNAADAAASGGRLAQARAGTLAWLMHPQSRGCTTVIAVVLCFLLALLPSTYIAQPSRSVVLAFIVALAAILLCELLAHVFAACYSGRPVRPDANARLCDNSPSTVLATDLLLVCGAVAAAALAFSLDFRVTDSFVSAAAGAAAVAVAMLTMPRLCCPSPRLPVVVRPVHAAHPDASSAAADLIVRQDTAIRQRLSTAYPRAAASAQPLRSGPSQRVYSADTIGRMLGGGTLAPYSVNARRQLQAMPASFVRAAQAAASAPPTHTDALVLETVTGRAMEREHEGGFQPAAWLAPMQGVAEEGEVLEGGREEAEPPAIDALAGAVAEGEDHALEALGMHGRHHLATSELDTHEVLHSLLAELIRTQSTRGARGAWAAPPAALGSSEDAGAAPAPVAEPALLSLDVGEEPEEDALSLFD